MIYLKSWQRRYRELSWWCLQVCSTVCLSTWTIHAPTKEQVRTALGILKDMGVLGNLQKSSLTPIQKLCWLGIERKTVGSSLRLSSNNALSIRSRFRAAYFKKYFHSSPLAISAWDTQHQASRETPGLPQAPLSDEGGAPKRPSIQDTSYSQPPILSMVASWGGDPDSAVGTLFPTVFISTDVSDVSWGFQSS